MKTEDRSRAPRVAISSTRKLLIVYYLLTIHLIAGYFLADELAEKFEVVPAQTSVPTTPPIAVSEPSALPSPALTAPAATLSPAANVPNVPPPNPAGLIIPVEGVTPGQLTDSFADSRSEGRVHDAIDIMAPAGTPVLAVADGTIVKLWDSLQGGITIYQLSSDKKFVYYYAHLQRRADDLKVGDEVKQGRTLGFVGDTGNAGAGNYHLHFSISVVNDPNRYWEGVSINPFPLLTK